MSREPKKKRFAEPESGSKRRGRKHTEPSPEWVDDGLTRRERIVRRIGFPLRSNPWGPYVELMGGRVRTILVGAIEALLLVIWAFIYKTSSDWIGLVRLNNLLLDDDIRSGAAQKVKAVGADKSLVTFSGLNYPPGSAEKVVQVSGKYENAYYVPSKLTLLAPMDFWSVFQMAMPVFGMAAGTLFLWWALRTRIVLVTREQGIVDYLMGPLRRLLGRDPDLDIYERYSCIAYETTPFSIRFVKTLTAILMIMSVGSWLWPLI